MLWFTQTSAACTRPLAVMLSLTCWCDMPRHPRTPVSALLQAVIPMEQLKDYIAYARMR